MPNWIGFRLVPTPERLLKEPVNGASDTNSATWLTFTAAVQLVTSRRASVLGIAMPPDRRYTGIDLDHCLDTAGNLKDWAAAMVAPFLGKTYIERTPSGEGLRIWTRGHKPNMPKVRSKKTLADGAVEIYDHDRFFTVTGRPYQDAPRTVAPLQDEIDVLYHALFPPTQRQSTQGGQAGLGALDIDDEELLTRARNAKVSGARFCALFDLGDLSGNGNDHSAADLALCNLLAFWCGPDANRIDRLFRRSALYREKWEREDYHNDTIGEALDGRQTFYSGPTHQVSTSRATRPTFPNQIEKESESGEMAADDSAADKADGAQIIDLDQMRARLRQIEAENAALRSENQRLKEANVRLNQRLQWERNVAAVPNKVLSASTRQTISLIRHDLDRDGLTLASDGMRRMEDGGVRIDTTILARRHGKSPSTICRDLSEAATVGALPLRKWVEDTPRGKRPRIAIIAGPQLMDPKTWQRPEGEERNMGGKRENAGRKPKCQSCGSEDVRVRRGVETIEREFTEIRCKQCGDVHHEPTGVERSISTRFYSAPETGDVIGNQIEKESEAGASSSETGTEIDENLAHRVDADVIVPDLRGDDQAGTADAAEVPAAADVQRFPAEILRASWLAPIADAFPSMPTPAAPPDDGYTRGRPCMVCSTPLRIRSEGGGYLPCESCSPMANAEGRAG